MNVDELMLVSVDDHVDRAPSLVRGPGPGQVRGRGPPVHSAAPTGRMAWVYDGKEIVNVGRQRGGRETAWTSTGSNRLPSRNSGSAAMTSTPGSRTWTPMGCWGRCASRPSLGLSGRCSCRPGISDQAAAMVRAYNDWHIDEWAGTYPGRFMPLALPMMWDAEASAAEVRQGGGEGLPRRELLGESVRVGASQRVHGLLGSGLEGVRGRGHGRRLHAPWLVVARRS